MVQIVKDYLDLCNENPNLHNTTLEKAEYIVSGCFETFSDVEFEDED